MVYAYCRISTAQQSVERQVRNAIALYPDCKIFKEVYTGTKTTGRKELEKILARVQKGDTILFDSVSRMSRDATEGTKLYFELYEKGVNLEFIKEPHINTSTYRDTLTAQSIHKTGTEVDIILEAVETYLKKLAGKQIELAFMQAQKEVDDLHQRTAEGIETARRNGKQIGQKQGAKLTVKKAIDAKKIIQAHSVSFGGSLSDADCMKLAGVSRNTYYKYKKEISESNWRQLKFL